MPTDNNDNSAGLKLPSGNLHNEWNSYTNNLKSPKSFLDFSFFFMIGAALQRRVWKNSCEMPLFPNPYILLVGDPGVGKGLALHPVNKLLHYHKKNPLKTGLDETVLSGSRVGILNELDKLSDKERDALKEAEDLLAKHRPDEKSNPEEEKTKPGHIEEPLLFPIAPKSITFEELASYMSKQVRRKDVPPELRCALVPKSGIYTHCSIAFILTELSSLFKKRTDKLVDFLTDVFDCLPYVNATKTAGTDNIRNGCLSLIGGTTPSFLQDTYSEKLLDEGFSARTVFVFADKNRFKQYGMPELTIDQLESKLLLLAHLKNLSQLFGQVTMSPDAQEYMKHYFEKTNYITNSNIKLKPYYGRKDIITDKLAMAIHFSRSYSMEIQLIDCQQAVVMLNAIEPVMHLAFTSGGQTPQSKATKKILDFLRYNKSEHFDFYHIWSKVCETEIEEPKLREHLTSLTEAGLIIQEGAGYRSTAMSSDEVEAREREKGITGLDNNDNKIVKLKL
jgi:DNA-binding transcriptional ArsR family regulator